MTVRPFARVLCPLLALALAVGCSSEETKKDSSPPGATAVDAVAMSADGAVEAGRAPDAAAASDVSTARDAAADTAATPDTSAVSPPDTAPVDMALPMTNVTAPWKHIDIGDVGETGSSQVAAGTFTISGSGADIWTESDMFTFVYQPFSGDGEIVARVVSVESVDQWTKGGVMFRAALTPTSPNVALVGTAMQGTSFQWRPSEAVASLNKQGSFLMPPRWLKLVRSGGLFVGSVSSDGLSWLEIWRVTVTMPKDIYVGLAVTSHSNGASAKAVFDNVSVKVAPPVGDGGVADAARDVQPDQSTDLPPATPPPAAWTAADIGMPGVPGTAQVAGSTFVLSGSGVDIGGTADAFTSLFQTLDGDGEISARVLSVEQTHLSAKAGVMIRASLDPSAAYVAAVATPGAGTHMLYRDDTANATTDVAAGFVPAPVWVKAARTGTLVVASMSLDGTSWIELGRATVALPARVYIGLVTTSRTNHYTSTGLLGDVKVTKYPPYPAGLPASDGGYAEAGASTDGATD